eukprot:3154191-Rhodomonas_salina.3
MPYTASYVLLQASYAVSGTEIAYAPTRRRAQSPQAHSRCALRDQKPFPYTLSLSRTLCTRKAAKCI